MTILDILNYPDPRLHKVASSVDEINSEIISIVRDMTETMNTAPGIGLSATQVNYHKKIIIIDISEKKDDLLILINPEIVSSDGQQESQEGCLSVPGIYETVKRASKISIRALNVDGDLIEFVADGKLSICIQHEMDHLMGKVFVEYLSPLKKSRIKTKMIKKNKKFEAS